MPSMVQTGAGQSTVTAAPSTVDSGQEAAVTIVVNDSSGEPIAGIAASEIVVAVSGSTNTITQPSGVTSAAGAIGASFTSTTAEAKTVSVTVAGLAITDTAAVTVAASGGAATWRGNEPVGLTTFATTDFTAADAWNNFAGDTGTASGFDASAVSPPRSSPYTMRFVVPTGAAAGEFIGNADPGNFASPAQRVYTCAWIRYSALATMHPATWKFWYFYHATNQTLGGAVIGMRPLAGEVTAPGGIRLSMESQGGSGTTLWNTAGSVITRGTWHLLETDMQFGTSGDGTFRAWVDGVLVMDITGISYRSDNGGWADLHLDPYYGGNSPGHTVDTDTYLDVDEAYVSWSAA